MCSADIFLGLLAILFPPLAVWVKCGLCSADSIINILLCMLGYIPGLIHAWYIIAKYPEPDYDYQSLPQHNESGGRVTYVFVHADDRQNNRRQPKPQQGMNYGTASNNNASASSSSAPAPAAPAPAPGAASQAQQSQNDNAGEGRSDAPPPSYAQVVAGDHKIQSQE